MLFLSYHTVRQSGNLKIVPEVGRKKWIPDGGASPSNRGDKVWCWPSFVATE